MLSPPVQVGGRTMTRKIRRGAAIIAFTVAALLIMPLHAFADDEATDTEPSVEVEAEAAAEQEVNTEAEEPEATADEPEAEEPSDDDEWTDVSSFDEGVPAPAELEEPEEPKYDPEQDEDNDDVLSFVMALARIRGNTYADISDLFIPDECVWDLLDYLADHGIQDAVAYSADGYVDHICIESDEEEPEAEGERSSKSSTKTVTETKTSIKEEPVDEIMALEEAEPANSEPSLPDEEGEGTEEPIGSFISVCILSAEALRRLLQI